MALKDRLREVEAPLARPMPAEARPELLLHPNIPKPMHGLAPRNVMPSAWWNAERARACNLTDRHCLACGVKEYMDLFGKPIEVHESYDIDYPKGTMAYVEPVPLCHACHSFVHSGRTAALLDKGEITKEKYDAIMRHGKAVLREAGLDPPKTYQGKMAEWGRWRLVVGKEKFNPKFKSMKHWLREFG